MTEAQATLNAQRAANREGRAMCVLNLNPYSPLYVVREHNTVCATPKGLVVVCYPETTT